MAAAWFLGSARPHSWVDACEWGRIRIRVRIRVRVRVRLGLGLGPRAELAYVKLCRNLTIMPYTN